MDLEAVQRELAAYDPAAASAVEKSEEYMARRAGRYYARAVDAVGSEFGDGRAPYFHRPPAGWRVIIRCAPQDRLQDL
jgi:hypothetical protein